MIELTGKYNSCKIFTDDVDKATLGQIQVLLNTEYMKDYTMRFMPDCHTGKGCTIGSVINISDDKIPIGLLGDLGCGILAVRFRTEDGLLDLNKLDYIIHENVPSGRHIFDTEKYEYFEDKLERLIANVDIKKAKMSLGTLGGGNHFIEVDQDSNGDFWLLIHTGSRYLGQQVCEYWQKLAWSRLKDKAAGGNLKEQTKRLTEYYTSIHETKKLSKALSELRSNYKSAKPNVPYELAYLEGEDAFNCHQDLDIIKEYAIQNRLCIWYTIRDMMKIYDIDIIDTIHNYIAYHVLRKGAIRAIKGEKVIIPLNMRDGALLCIGKGNPDWVHSGPHGAGRSLSRKDARNSISMQEYRDSMNGIFSTCITKDTIDESCFAYKDSNEIITNIQDTVEVIDTLKPVYNFKAGGENE